MDEHARRIFLKQGIAAVTAITVGLPVAKDAAAQAKAADAGIDWDKGVCRFCGTGCGIQIGTQGGRIVATKGDPDAPVNRGLNCIKGYFNGKIPYGQDRLTQPLMRMKDGKFDKNGPFYPVSWKVAMDEMERQFRKTYAELGPTGVAIIGSGQYTIQEGYAAAKLMKAGFRSNNIDPNARLCMASAVAAFMQVFGIDEPANLYGDIELADLIVLWGANMAEAHPVLWSRITDRKLGAKTMRIVNISTYGNMSSGLADLEIIMKPNADLAIQNYIAREIVERGLVNLAFVDRHCIFATGPTDIGYGMRGDDRQAYPAEKDVLKRELEVELDKYEAIGQRRKAGEKVAQKNRGAGAGRMWQISFDEFRRGLEPYTLDFVTELAKGDPDEPFDDFKRKLKQLADLYCDNARNTVSYWTMGFNQNVRGTWLNEQTYMIHLLLGKYARPGNGAFSLTGQPSACGTAREVGTFSHRLPADMVVTSAADRARTEQLWKLPANTLNPQVGSAIMKILRDMEDGTIKFCWVQVNNPFQSNPNANHWLKAAREKDNFVVVADVYPTISAKVADLILPAAIIFEKWGAYGNGERRTQVWRQRIDPPGEARTDLWMLMEFAKRFKLKDVWSEKTIPGLKAEGYPDGKLPDVLAAAGKLGYRPEQTLYEVLFATPENRKVPWPDAVARGAANSTVKSLGEKWFPEKALFNEYRQFGLGHGHDLGPFDLYYQAEVRGLTWPVVDGKETSYRFNASFDPYVKKGSDFDFYGPAMKAIPSGNLDGVTDPKPVASPGRAKIFFRPYAAPAESPDRNYDLWLCTGRILEHWHTGSMTRRVPELHRAAPAAVLYMNPGDAEKRGLKRNDIAWVESRRGKIKAAVETQGRNKMPRGTTFLAFFDEGVMVNKLVIDATDPISLEPDFKKSAVKVAKA